MLGLTTMEGENGAMVNLIDKEKVSLPVLMKSSTEVRSKKLHVFVACTLKQTATLGLA